MPGMLPEDSPRAPLSPWLLMTTVCGGALAAYVATAPMPATMELEELPDRCVRVVAMPSTPEREGGQPPSSGPAEREVPDRPASTGPRDPDPRSRVLTKSKLLLKLISVDSFGPTDDLELGLGDIDVALDMGGVTSDASTLGAHATGPSGASVVRPPPVPPPSLSTFSVDVDTASWTRSESQLSRGQRPSPDGVRVEEFVNAFRYDYDPPTGDRAFAVHAMAAPSPWGDGTHLLRIGLQGETLTEDRVPVHLTFLVDTSGSMGDIDKLPLVVSSLHTLVDHLRPSDTVALVTYAGDSRIVLDPTSLSAPETVHRAIDRLRSGGGTDMADGIYTAYHLASEAYVDGHVNRVVLASDGDANIGPSDPGGITPAIQEYADGGITLTTLGFGQHGYNDHMMERLANDGDGVYFHIPDRREANRVLGTELTSTLHVVARDVKIQVAFDADAVKSFRLVGYDNRRLRDEDFANDAVDAGEVGSGHQVSAVYALDLRDNGVDLGEVRIRYKRPGPESPSREIVAAIGRPVQGTLASTPDAFRKAVALAGFAQVLRGDPGMGSDRLDVVQELLEGSVADGAERDRLVAAVNAARRVLNTERVHAALWRRPQASMRDGEDVRALRSARHYVPQLGYCYEAQWRLDSEVSGTVSLEWTVRDGRVVGMPILVANSTGSEALAACVQQKVRRWTFDGFDGELSDSWHFPSR